MATKKYARIALIVSTYNWPEALTLCLRSVFRQTRLPDEIIIADDGSGESTRRAIEKLTEESPRPVRHLWQEDRGFRKTEILNKAMAAADADYIIEVDGDVILERHFIEDHMAVAEAGCFVCGGRVKLGKEESQGILSQSAKIRIGLGNSQFANSLRISPLRWLLERRYAQGASHVRGCNIAFWRKGLVRVNGYDEALTGYGYEDIELALRLINAGVRRKSLKFGGVCYHLFHETAPQDRYSINKELTDKTIAQKRSRCEKGLDSYLSGQTVHI